MYNRRLTSCFLYKRIGFLIGALELQIRPLLSSSPNFLLSSSNSSGDIRYEGLTGGFTLGSKLNAMVHAPTWMLSSATCMA